ncbi:hypothetical protein SLA2020_310480 [Shorea laevis]
MINVIKVRINKVDSWRWVHSSDGLYSMKAAYDFLTPKDCILNKKWSGIIWCKFAPFKLSVFGWRLFLNRLATKDNLGEKGIVLLGVTLVVGYVVRKRNNFIISFVSVKGHGLCG